MSVSFKFTPSAKAFPNAKPSDFREINVEIAPVKLEDGGTAILAHVNGKPLSTATIAHAVAFAIKQRLANSFVSASTAKNEAGGLLPEAERLTQWGALFDKVLAKITDAEARPDWTSVFTGSSDRESADPFLSEVNRIAISQLRAWAASKSKALPKAGSDEFKAMVAKLLSARREPIESEARRRLAEVAAIGDLDELDFGEATE